MINGEFYGTIRLGPDRCFPPRGSVRMIINSYEWIIMTSRTLH
jgi:hypothetical protein